MFKLLKDYGGQVVVFTSGWRLDIQREWVIHRAGCCFLLLVLFVFFGDLNVFQIPLSSEDEGGIISSLVLV